MIKKFLVLVAVLVATPAWAASPIYIQDAVSGVMRPARSDDFGGATSGSGGTASLSVGLILEDIRQIATNTVTRLADITSGTAAPFWVTLRNVGDKTIHYSTATPTNYSDGIVASQQVALYFATNTPALTLQSNSSGVSSMATNIWK